MMLQALIAYAERLKLAENPDFEAVGIRWLIPLDARGKLAGGPIPQFEAGTPDARKPKPRRVVRPKSDPDFVGHGRSYFLCDTLDRCLLFTDDDEKQAKRKVNQDYFIQLLETAANDCPAEKTRLLLLASFLRDADELKTLHEKFIAEKADPSEKAAFQIDGVELLKSAELFAWWHKQCERDRAAATNEEAVCLATGKFGAVCRTTGFIKGLTEDTKLISFNKQCPAFESYGLEQGANAPISMEAEEKFRSALDDLIQRSRDHRLEFNGTFYLHWTKEDVYDPTDLLAEPNPQEIAKALRQTASPLFHRLSWHCSDHRGAEAPV